MLEQVAAESTALQGLASQGGGISQVRPVQAPPYEVAQLQTTEPLLTLQVPPLRQGKWGWPVRPQVGWSWEQSRPPKPELQVQIQASSVRGRPVSTEQLPPPTWQGDGLQGSGLQAQKRESVVVPAQVEAGVAAPQVAASW